MGIQITAHEGILVVDKPTGLTSHDVVARCRRALGTRRVGHAGTLDPLATGVLVLGAERGTKLLTYLVGVDKTYQATIRLGWSTTTDDAQGEVLQKAVPDAVRGVSSDAIAFAVQALTGQIDQIPSAVSAIKVDGRRAYARVRAGEQVDLPARSVTVSRFEVGGLRQAEEGSDPVIDVDVEVDCSSGTYIRALARDLGAALGVGGHLTALRRTRVGPFDLSDAVPLDLVPERVDRCLLPLSAAASRVMPVRHLTADEVDELRFGRRIKRQAELDEPVAGLGPDGSLVAVLAVSGGQLRPTTVFVRDQRSAGSVDGENP